MIALNLLAGLILSVNGVIHDCNNEVVNYILVKGSDITVQNCRVRESGMGTNAVSVWGNNNTLRNLLVERSGAGGVAFFEGDGHVLEDSVIRDPIRRKGRDSWGVINNLASNLTVQRVTVYGSGYTQWDAAAVGTKLLNNTFIVPEDYRTDCKGNIQRDGPCQCAEFGIAIKGGDGGLVEGNTISGYHKADPVCGGSGTPGVGIATSACAPFETCDTNKWTYSHNVISNSHFGIFIGKNTLNNVITANRFCNNDTGISDGYSVNAQYIDNEIYRSPTLFYNKRPASESGSRQIVSCD